MQITIHYNANYNTLQCKLQHNTIHNTIHCTIQYQYNTIHCTIQYNTIQCNTIVHLITQNDIIQHKTKNIKTALYLSQLGTHMIFHVFPILANVAYKMSACSLCGSTR